MASLYTYGTLIWIVNSFLLYLINIFFIIIIIINRNYFRSITLGKDKYSKYWAMQIFLCANKGCIFGFWHIKYCFKIFYLKK